MTHSQVTVPVEMVFLLSRKFKQREELLVKIEFKQSVLKKMVGSSVQFLMDLMGEMELTFLLVHFPTPSYLT